MVVRPGDGRLDDRPAPDGGAGRHAGAARPGRAVRHRPGDHRRQIDPAFIRYPIGLGHEWTGIVTGDSPLAGSPRRRRGHRRLAATARGASRGETNLCETYDEFGFTRDGAAAGQVAVPAALVHPIAAERRRRGRGADRAGSGRLPRPGQGRRRLRAAGCWSSATARSRCWPSTCCGCGRRPRSWCSAAARRRRTWPPRPAPPASRPRRRPRARVMTSWSRRPARSTAAAVAFTAARRGGTVLLLGLPPHGADRRAGRRRHRQQRPDDPGQLQLHGRGLARRGQAAERRADQAGIPGHAPVPPGRLGAGDRRACAAAAGPRGKVLLRDRLTAASTYERRDRPMTFTSVNPHDPADVLGEWEPAGPAEARRRSAARRPRPQVWRETPGAGPGEGTRDAATALEQRVGGGHRPGRPRGRQAGVRGPRRGGPGRGDPALLRAGCAAAGRRDHPALRRPTSC